MMARLQQFADAQGLPTRAIHAQDPTNYENMLRALGDAGAAIVLGTFPVISDAFKAVAPAYPHTRWCHFSRRLVGHVHIARSLVRDASMACVLPIFLP